MPSGRGARRSLARRNGGSPAVAGPAAEPFDALTPSQGTTPQPPRRQHHASRPVKGRAQPGEGHRDEPPDGGPRPKAVGRRDGVEAVGHELVGRHCLRAFKEEPDVYTAKADGADATSVPIARACRPSTKACGPWYESCSCCPVGRLSRTSKPRWTPSGQRGRAPPVQPGICEVAEAQEVARHERDANDRPERGSVCGMAVDRTGPACPVSSLPTMGPSTSLRQAACSSSGTTRGNTSTLTTSRRCRETTRPSRWPPSS